MVVAAQEMVPAIRRLGKATLCAPLYVSPAEFADGVATQQSQGALELALQQVQAALNAPLTAGRERIEIATADTAGVRAQRQCFDNMGTTSNATIAYDLQPVMQGIGHAGNTIHRRRRGLKLAPPMIG